MSAFSAPEAAHLDAAAAQGAAPASPAALSEPSARVAAPSVSADEARVYGLLEWGAMLLALPVANLREVVACPPKLAPLPPTMPALQGCIVLRGLSVPVLDLGLLLGLPPLEIPGRVIVVMRWRGRLLGLLAGAVRGIARCQVRTLTALHVAPEADRRTARIATHTLYVDDEVATLLDAEIIAMLPGVPMVDEAEAQRNAGANAGPREAALLFRAGSTPLGIDALAVDATVPRARLFDSPLQRGLCVGVTPHHGHEVPVIDTLALLGLGAAPAVTETALVVLRFGAGRIGLMIDRVEDIVHVRAGEVLPLHAAGLPATELFRGMLAQPQHLLLDAAALQRHDVLASLAPLSRRGQTAAAARQAKAQAGAAGEPSVSARGMPYLSYLAGVELASPLTQVLEIITLPAELIAFGGGRAATLGLFAHRGAALPLVCLSTLRGEAAVIDPARARVLIVEAGGRRAGLLVQALCAIEVAQWEAARTSPAPQEAALGRSPVMSSLIEVGEGVARRTLSSVDLGQVVLSLAD